MNSALRTEAVKEASIRPVRLGIVGCGVVTGSYHLPALAKISEIEVVILCDPNLKNATDLKTRFAPLAEITANAKDLVGKVDAALVAAPPRFHAPISIQLLEAGIDVFCEKPLALTVDEAKKMVEAAKQNDRHLAVGLCKRFEPNNQILLKLVQDRCLGEVREITAEFGNALNWPMPTASNNATIAGAPASFEPPASRNMPATRICRPQSAIGANRHLPPIDSVCAAVVDGE